MENQVKNMDEQEKKNLGWRGVYKPISLSLSVVFAVVGLLFLLIPNGVLVFFNNISPFLGLPQSPVPGDSLYSILAVGYMYLVTLLAYLMYRHPENTYFPWLLINGKSASSLISLFLFIFHRHYLIYVTNGVVDGLIAVSLLVLYRKTKGTCK